MTVGSQQFECCRLLLKLVQHTAGMIAAVLLFCLALAQAETARIGVMAILQLIGYDFQTTRSPFQIDFSKKASTPFP